MNDQYYILQGLLRLRKEYIHYRDVAFQKHHVEVFNDYQEDLDRVNEVIDKVKQKGKKI